jgi:hypothetical protein
MNKEIFLERQERRKTAARPLVGDAVSFNDKIYFIGCFHENKTFQLVESGSFYLCDSGDMDFSGAFTLFNPIETEKLTLIKEEIMHLECWFFSENRAGYNRSVRFPCEVKVFKL